jgi:DNA-binding protein H-NS
VSSLWRRYERDRLEAACERALAINAISYSSVNAILKKEAKIITFPVPGADVGTMLPKKPPLDTLSNRALCKLRDEIAEELKIRAEGLRREIEQLVGPISPASAVRHGGPEKGSKVAPRYRGPHGEMWSGRGKNPRWLTAAINEGKRPEDFLIDKRKKNRVDEARH